MRRILALVLFTFACSRSEQLVGGFSVAWTDTGYTVLAPDGRLLVSSSGAPLSSRTTTADAQMLFGAFKFTEDDSPAWADGTKLTATSSSGRVLLDFGGGRKLTFTSGETGRLDVQVDAPATDDRVKARFACAATDHFLGFGGQEDAVDHRGHEVPVFVTEAGIGKTDHDDIEPSDTDWMVEGTRHASSYPLPTFLSNRGMAFLADTTVRTVFDLCNADQNVWSVEAWASSMTLRIYDGPQPTAAIERLTADIGRQPLANDVVLAPWNDAIFGSQHVRDVAALLRTNHIPSAAIWTEDFRGGGDSGDTYHITDDWDVDRTLYPDVEQVAKDLHSQGFRWLAYHNTFVTQGMDVYGPAKDAGVLLHHADGSEYDFVNAEFLQASMIDFTHPQGAAFVEAALEKLLGYGFDGWMSDYGEWLPTDVALADGSDALAYHDTYPRAYETAVTEAMKHHPDPAHAVVFSRSGTLRTAPLQQVVWGGDQWTSFAPDDGLPTVVTMGLDFGLAGIDLYAHDIAGYQNAENPPSTKELFFRWTEVGALSPVMRTHHGTKARLNWWFGSDQDSTDHFGRWARFHAGLWPYTKAASLDAFNHGLPIMRQLALAYPESDTAWTQKDEYLFGPSLFVAPVLVEGATSRDVWFPPGQWMPYAGGDELAGDQTTTIQVPLTEIGLFVHPGTIIPMLPDRLDTLMPADPPLVTLADVQNERTLVVFAGADGSWTDLDGTTYAITSSAHTPPDAVVSGSSLPSCSSGAPPCATIDAANRTATVMGQDFSSVAFNAGASTVSTVTIKGALNVSQIVYRW